jgi:imidazole glycerol phosphate synthase subunit HisF
MYLKSTKTVTYNDTKNTNKTVLMTAKIEEIYASVGSGETKIVYNYIDVDGVVHSHESYILTDIEKDTLYPLISSSLPDITVVGESSFTLAKYYEGFKYKMAERFPELEVVDISYEAEPVEPTES